MHFPTLSVLFLGLAILGEARGDSSLDVLDRDLQTLTAERQAAKSGALLNFVAQIEIAAARPEAALQLYQQAGGAVPNPARISTDHAVETVSEREEREQTDRRALELLARTVQFHCALLKQATALLIHRDDPAARQAYRDWLKAAATTYPGLIADITAPSENAPPARRRRGDAGDLARRVLDLSMAGSIFCNYLNFHQWGEGGSGGWRLRDLPGLYRTEILVPAQAGPSPEVRAAWDTYLALRSAEVGTSPQWPDESAFLQFQRAADLFKLSPTLENLTTAVTLIRANPTNSHGAEMLQQAQKMLVALKQANPQANPASSAPPPTSNPNVPLATPPGEPAPATAQPVTPPPVSPPTPSV